MLNNLASSDEHPCWLQDRERNQSDNRRCTDQHRIAHLEPEQHSETDNRYRARQLLTPQDPSLGDAMGAPIDGPVGQPVAIAVFNIPK